MSLQAITRHPSEGEFEGRRPASGTVGLGVVYTSKI